MGNVSSSVDPMKADLELPNTSGMWTTEIARLMLRLQLPYDTPFVFSLTAQVAVYPDHHKSITDSTNGSQNEAKRRFDGNPSFLGATRGLNPGPLASLFKLCNSG